MTHLRHISCLALSAAGMALACAPSTVDSAGSGGSASGGSNFAVGGSVSDDGDDGLAGGTNAVGGAPAVGGSSSAGGGPAGGTTAVGGAPGSGGSSSTGGGAGGTGGSDAEPTVDSDGCPVTLEGFATLSSAGQDGTYGGKGGEIVIVDSQADLDFYATAPEPYVIRVEGKITIAPKGTEIRVASNKTIVGIGSTGEISQGGFFLATDVHNVILRNLTIGDTFVEGDEEGKTQDFDGVQMDTAHHVWIDHCHFHHGGDGLIDSRKDTSFLTVSWNVLSDHNKAFGIGWTENVPAQMTVHHNILRDLNQRNPSADNVLRAHLYNNWMQRLGSYGNYARGGTNMVLENSVFESVESPHYYDTGTLVARGNVYESVTGLMESSGSEYSYFDPSDFYDYDLDATDQVEGLLTACAGPRPTLGQ